MLACKLKLQLNFCLLLLLLSLQLSAILCRKENGGNNGVVMTLHHTRSVEGFVPAEAGPNHDDQAYQRLAKMQLVQQASMNSTAPWPALKRGMIMKYISDQEGSLYAFSDTLEYYIKLSVGTPPQDLLLVMDTGSDVVWAPCTRKYTCSNDCSQHSRVFLRRKSSSAVTVNCADPKCKDLCGNGGCVGSIQYNCSGACPKYQLLYGTGNATGRLLSEILTLPLEDGGRREIKDFGVGCSMVSSVFAGIAGFDRGGLSMPSQLSSLLGDNFAYCLNGQDNSSRIVLGDMAVPKDTPFNYTPFLNNSRGIYRDFYYIGLQAVSIGRKRLKLPSKFSSFDSKGNGGTIIDSGTAVTRFPDSIYHQIVGELASQIRYRRIPEVEVKTGYGLCYNVSGHVEKKIQFPEFAFHFKGGSDMVLPYENSFVWDSHIYCLAMLSMGSVLEFRVGPAVILGNYQQQNFYVLYDREKNRLGFTRKACETLG